MTPPHLPLYEVPETEVSDLTLRSMIDDFANAAAHCPHGVTVTRERCRELAAALAELGRRRSVGGGE